MKRKMGENKKEGRNFARAKRVNVGRKGKKLK
jgi:hypothetical protein